MDLDVSEGASAETERLISSAIMSKSIFSKTSSISRMEIDSCLVSVGDATSGDETSLLCVRSFHPDSIQEQSFLLVWFGL